MLTPTSQPTIDEAFIKRAMADPGGIEAKVLEAAQSEAAHTYQLGIRKMLTLMIDKVPGQLARDVEAFHKKFQLPPVEGPGHRLPKDLLEFRLKFLAEELCEYAEACGASITMTPWHDKKSHQKPQIDFNDQAKFDPEKAFDGLIDLAYVLLGTAYLHRFPFNAGWDRVQEKNMQKVRVERADDDRSVRKSKFDVVKPEGWTPPVLTDLLDPEPADDRDLRGVPYDEDPLS